MAPGWFHAVWNRPRQFDEALACDPRAVDQRALKRAATRHSATGIAEGNEPLASPFAGVLRPVLTTLLVTLCACGHSSCKVAHPGGSSTTSLPMMRRHTGMDTNRPSARDLEVWPGSGACYLRSNGGRSFPIPTTGCTSATSATAKSVPTRRTRRTVTLLWSMCRRFGIFKLNHRGSSDPGSPPSGTIPAVARSGSWFYIPSSQAPAQPIVID